MGALHDAEKLLEKLTRAEKAQLLQWVVRDLGEAFLGIESIPRTLRRRALHRSHAHSYLAPGAGPLARRL